MSEVENNDMTDAAPTDGEKPADEDVPMTEEEKKFVVDFNPADYDEQIMMEFYCYKNVNDPLPEDERERLYTVHLTQKEISVSGLVRMALDGDTKCRKMELPSIRCAKTMDYIVKYCKKSQGVECKKIEAPLRSMDLEDVVGEGNEWYAEFINGVGREGLPPEVKIDIETELKEGESKREPTPIQQLLALHDLLLSASYLSITNFVHLIASKFASICRDESIEFIDNRINEYRVQQGIYPPSVLDEYRKKKAEEEAAAKLEEDGADEPPAVKTE